MRSMILVVLSTIYTVSLVVANIASNKITLIFGYSIDAGYLFFPLTYIINDIVTEVYGLRSAKQLIISGLLGNLFAVVSIQIIILMPPDPCFQFQGAFQEVFQSSIRLFVASIISYFCGELLNAKVLVFMKEKSGESRMALRFIVSTVCGGFVENTLFYLIAFLGSLDWPLIREMMIVQYLLKVGIELLVLPATCYFTSFLKRKAN